MAKYTPQQRAYIVRLAEKYPYHDIFVGFNGPRIPEQSRHDPTVVVLFALKDPYDHDAFSFCETVDPEGRSAHRKLEVTTLSGGTRGMN